MPLRCLLKQDSSIPLEVDGVRLETVRRQSVDEIRATPIQRGNEQLPLGDFFDVSGSAADDNELIWVGDCSRVKLIGAHLSSGRIRVEGNAGMHLGAEMTGGEILVDGNAGDWVGAEMHGGRIRVHGNAGHLVGAVYRGGRRGMTGGEILINGDAGNEIGHTMRRGTIAVGGRSGDAPGFNMIAGSILLFGEAGIRPGAGMRRGTILLARCRDKESDSQNPALCPQGPAPKRPEMLPTFKFACTYRPVFLRFYLRWLASCGFPVPPDCLEAAYHRYCGDFLEEGRGEILVRAGD